VVLLREDHRDQQTSRLVFDGDLGLLRDRTVAVIGYGNQGRAQAIVLRDNGIRVIVGNIRDHYWDRAVKDGFEVYNIGDAVRRADIALLLLSDEIAPGVYRESIEPLINNRRGFILCFASGYNIAYGFIKPPQGVDVIMVAPRMIGWGILERHRQGRGYPVLIGVAQDSSGMALEYAKAIAKGIGAIGLPGGVAVISSLEEEALLDLLSESTWSPMLIAAMEAYFDVVTENFGVSPEAAILELYASGELAEIGRAMAEIGFYEQLKLQSRTSQFLHLTRARNFYKIARRIVEREALNIWSGKITREWSPDLASGRVILERLLRMAMRSRMAEYEDRLYRALGRR
jgi:ketol-acid reductoisomerase